jgi:NAD(P)-dependent dehydrogenase (short-subunit alcohol dehydrogenase family)
MLMAKRVAALITGCNGGIGQALCREFRAAGYLVIGTDLHEKKEADCDLYLSCDLLELATDSLSQKWFQNAIHGFLGEQSAELQVVINNAALQVTKPLDSLSSSEFLACQKINVVAPFVIAKLFEELLRKAKGSIVNIGSIHSKLTKPRFCAYSTSKAALSGLTRALALEFSGEVNVNVILPGATRTAMLLAGFREQTEKYQELESFQPVGRIAEPEEIAHLALFLCSPNARFITGSDFPIDGGIGGCLHDPI